LSIALVLLGFVIFLFLLKVIELENGLDKAGDGKVDLQDGIEVASVSDVLETARDTVLSLPFLWL